MTALYPSSGLGLTPIIAHIVLIFAASGAQDSALARSAISLCADPAQTLQPSSALLAVTALGWLKANVPVSVGKFLTRAEEGASNVPQGSILMESVVSIALTYA